VIRRLLSSERIDFISLRHSAFDRKVYQALIDDGWIFVHMDDRYFVMVPRRPDSEALIRREGYQQIIPWDNISVTAANARQVLEEANRALQHCPGGATFAWAYKVKALRRLGRHQEAWEAQLRIPATVDQKRLPIQWRSTESHGHPRRLSTV
jgi:hypothetical protein